MSYLIIVVVAWSCCIISHAWRSCGVLNCHPHSCHDCQSAALHLYSPLVSFYVAELLQTSKRFWLSALWIGECSEEYFFIWLMAEWFMDTFDAWPLHRCKHTLPWKCRTSDVCGATSASLQLSPGRFDLTCSAVEEKLTENTANFLVISLQEQGTNKISLEIE